MRDKNLLVNFSDFRATSASSKYAVFINSIAIPCLIRVNPQLVSVDWQVQIAKWVSGAQRSILDLSSVPIKRESEWVGNMVYKKKKKKKKTLRAGRAADRTRNRCFKRHIRVISDLSTCSQTSTLSLPGRLFEFQSNSMHLLFQRSCICNYGHAMESYICWTQRITYWWQWHQ